MFPTLNLFPQVDITAIGVTNFTGPEGPFNVEVFDSASDYIKLMKYDFDWINIILHSAFIERSFMEVDLFVSYHDAALPANCCTLDGKMFENWSCYKISFE